MAEKINTPPPPIGIDLGTENSCVGVWRNEWVEIIQNQHGNKTTPSCVAFTDTQRCIGEAAKNDASTNPSNTILNVKRLLGKRFSSNNVQEDIKLLPFKVVSSQGDEPVISFQYQGNEKQFSALEISSMVLRNLRDTAEAFLGCPIQNAVIAVPACFNSSQRLATMQAANIAGLNVMRIINAPTAAAIAYGLDNIENNDDKKERRKKKKNILIFDLGSGSLDVSILIMERGNYEVKATRGDAHLGGVDFDNKLIIHCIEEFERSHNMKKGHLTSNLSPKAYAKLRASCEKAKRVLSTVDEAPIEIDSLTNGVDFYTSITRATFEGLNKDLFEKCICMVDRCLEDANMYRSSIDDIVVIGGSTRIPKVREMLHDFFEGKDLSRRINSDEAVACGAAIQAAILSGTNNNVPALIVNDITTQSLGIETPKKVLMIPRNTAIPTTVVVPAEHQMDYTIKVYEGERTRIGDNNLLGQNLSSRNNATSFVPYAVYFNVNQNGIFTISVEDKVVGQCKKRMKDITRDFMPMLSRKEIEKMAADAEELKGKEGEYKQRLEAKNELESFLIQLDKSIKMFKDPHKKKIVDAIEKTMKWLGNNPQAIGDEFGDQFGQHVNCLKEEWDGMLQRSPPPSTVTNSVESGFAKLTDLAHDLANSSTKSKSRTRNTEERDLLLGPNEGDRTIRTTESQALGFCGSSPISVQVDLIQRKTAVARQPSRPDPHNLTHRTCKPIACLSFVKTSKVRVNPPIPLNPLNFPLSLIY